MYINECGQWRPPVIQIPFAIRNGLFNMSCKLPSRQNVHFMTYLSSDWQINFLAIVYDKRIFVASYCNVLFKSDLGEALFDRQRKNLTAGVMQSKKGMNVMNGGKIIINQKKKWVLKYGVQYYFIFYNKILITLSLL